MLGQASNILECRGDLFFPEDDNFIDFFAENFVEQIASFGEKNFYEKITDNKYGEDSWAHLIVSSKTNNLNVA
jgi:hypothetical protein